MNAVDTHIMILDRQLRVRQINEAMKRSLGVDDIPMNVPANDLATNPYHRYILDRAAEVAQSDKPQRFESDSSFVEGHVREIRIVPWDGGVAIFSDDVTHQYEIRSSRARVEAISNALDLAKDFGSGTIDGNGRLIRFTQGLRRLLNVSDDHELMGTRFLSLFSTSSRSMIEPHLFAADKPVELRAELMAGGVDIVACELLLTEYWFQDGSRHHAFFVQVNNSDKSA